MVNEDYEVNDTDEDVLCVLKVRASNPYHIRAETGHSRQTVQNSLTRLQSAGWVRKVTKGLYELVCDPREK